MWMIAFLGAGSAYIESALAQVWKEEIGGVYRGGPAYYIEKGLGQKWYAVIFAVITILSCGILLPGIQANSIAAVHNAFAPVTAFIPAFSSPPCWADHLRRRQAHRGADPVVPFMAIGYILMATAIAVNTAGCRIIPGLFIGLAARVSAACSAAIVSQARIYSKGAGQAPARRPRREVSGPRPAGCRLFRLSTPSSSARPPASCC
jgi:AGCS family alanine or glycine:cation symporter